MALKLAATHCKCRQSHAEAVTTDRAEDRPMALLKFRECAEHAAALRILP